MISYLIGKPITNGSNLTLLVGGVGYEVRVTPKVIALATNKEELELHIYTHVKEEALHLYGFESIKEKDLFILLLSVSGVGPNTALNLLTTSSTKIIEAVQQAQVPFFTAIPRIGKKLAQKIIIELRGKLGEMKALELGVESQEYQDVLESMISLGFNEQAVITALENIDINKLGVEKTVKELIAKLSKKR